VTRARVALAALGLALVAPAASAHEVRPALLALREGGPAVWDVEWRVPARGPERLALAVVLPAGCEEAAPRRAEPVAGMQVERWRVRCAGGLAGGTISIAGLERTVTDVLVRVTHAGGAEQTARILPDRPSLVVAATPGALDVARTYLTLGAGHILSGVDHLLFVLALLIVVEGAGRLVRAITAFTAAHSLTLAAATLGWVRVPAAPVEATIALSIAFLAAGAVRARPDLAQRRPWVVAFAFGLLHGLGFAGTLAKVGLPIDAIPLALLYFNVGVEGGQLLFIAAALPALAGIRRIGPPGATAAWRVAAYGIGAVASYWTIERIAGFLG